MSALAYDLDELERDTEIERAKAYEKAERQCRIALSPSWPRAIPLDWNPGGLHGRKNTILLLPGKFVIQPLAKAQAWFGPFSLYFDIRSADEASKSKLRDQWRSEKKRYLDRYDYPRGNGRGFTPDMTPSGPHRSPDVTVTILEADGSEMPSLRLYEIYKIGEFDALKDSFEKRESAEEVEARYQRELAALNDRYEREATDNAKQIAELKGLVQGFMGTAPAGKSKGG